jgi:hypothetical protein
MVRYIETLYFCKMWMKRLAQGEEALQAFRARTIERYATSIEPFVMESVLNAPEFISAHHSVPST